VEGFLDTLDVVDARQFQVVVRRLADSLGYGTDHSRYLGSGIEYVQSRPYEAGDPVRSIDWRVTARTGKIFVKEHESPKRMPVQLLIDTSASMAISSTRRSKYATALYLAGGVALACLDRVSPVGVMGVGDRELRVQPSLSKAQVMQWLLDLRHFRYDEGTTLTRRMTELAPSLKECSLVIVFSDLHDEGAVDTLKTMAQRHDVAVVQVQDPAERGGLQGAGLMRAREAETGLPVWTWGRASQVDQEARDAELRRGGIDHLLLDTGHENDHAVRRFFESRGLVGRMAR
jgi:uncharacterized protein (DUF58 family)